VLTVQPVVLALVMAAVFPAPTPGFFFMLSLSCLWFGMSGSVRELIADRAIWQREARIGVGVVPYVASKALVLGGATLVQCVGLAAALYPVLGLAEYGFDLGLLAAISALVGLCGMSIGLFVSACWTSSEAAVGTLPLLLIPQIAFSSVMVSIRDMGPIAKGLTWLTIQRYAFDATLKTGEEMAHHRRPGMDFEPMGLLGILSRLGLKPTESGRSLEVGLSLPELSMVLAGVTAVLLVLTVTLVGLRTRRANR
jgi:ABC-type multidrug transport system permease subunit